MILLSKLRPSAANLVEPAGEDAISTWDHNGTDGRERLCEGNVAWNHQRLVTARYEGWSRT